MIESTRYQEWSNVEILTTRYVFVHDISSGPRTTVHNCPLEFILSIQDISEVYYVFHHFT
jgi:hypothetical protein